MSSRSKTFTFWIFLVYTELQINDGFIQNSRCYRNSIFTNIIKIDILKKISIYSVSMNNADIPYINENILSTDSDVDEILKNEIEGIGGY